MSEIDEDSDIEIDDEDSDTEIDDYPETIYLY
jgi:hypothetical protein